MEWIIHGKGHKNVRAKHKTTLEFTKEKELSPRGDCIVAIACDKAICEAPTWLRRWLLKGGRIKITIACGSAKDCIYACGSEKLSFSHPRDIVIRKSSYIDGRTLAVHSSKAAADLKRKLISELRKGKEVEIKIIRKISKS